MASLHVFEHHVATKYVNYEILINVIGDTNVTFPSDRIIYIIIINVVVHNTSILKVIN